MNKVFCIISCFFVFAAFGQTEETADETMQTDETAAVEESASEPEPEYDAGPNDAGVVRSILDANNMADVQIDVVAAFSAGRVIRLNLNNQDIGRQGLTVLPPEIGKLSALVDLSIDDNDLVQLPDELGNCRALVKISIRNNSIMSLPSTIGNLSELQEIDMRNNELTTLPMEIGLLGKLWKLQLWGNNIRTLPETFGSLRSLRELYLRGNRLTTFPVSVLKLKLNYIDIQDNRLCKPPGAIDNWLKKFDDKYRSWQKCW